MIALNELRETKEGWQFGVVVVAATYAITYNTRRGCRHLFLSSLFNHRCLVVFLIYFFIQHSDPFFFFKFLTLCPHSIDRCCMQAYSSSRGKAGGSKSKKFELTEEQKQEIREAFDLFDTDGSGKCVPRARALARLNGYRVIFWRRRGRDG